MKKTLFWMCTAICFALIIAPALADNSTWNGTWKLDQQKSKLTGVTFAYTVKSNGAINYAAGPLQYNFACDGKDYQMLDDFTIACKKTSSMAYNMTFKQKGKLLSSSARVLSADERTMTVTTKGTQPDGTPYTQVDVDERISGTSGIAGEWKKTNSSTNVASVIKIAVSGERITLDVPSFKQTVAAKLDGTDAPFTGPGLPAGLTVSFKLQGLQQLTEVVKLNGKPLSEDVMTMSSDGKTITDVTWSSGKANQQLTNVYERQ